MPELQNEELVELGMPPKELLPLPSPPPPPRTLRVLPDPPVPAMPALPPSDHVVPH